MLCGPRNSTVKLSIAFSSSLLTFPRVVLEKIGHLYTLSTGICLNFKFNAYANVFVYGFCLHQKDLNDRKYCSALVKTIKEIKFVNFIWYLVKSLLAAKNCCGAIAANLK